MNVNLPTPPTGSTRFLYDLVAKLTETFRKIKTTGKWRDKNVQINISKQSATSPPSWDAFIDGIYGYAFSASTMKQVWVSFSIPLDMALTYKNTDGTISPPMGIPYFHWSTGAGGTDTGAVRFGIEWTYAKGDSVQVFGSTQTFYVEGNGSGTPYTHMVSVGEAMSSADFEEGGTVLMRIFRDATHANDTLTDKVFLMGLNMRYWSDE